MFRLILIISQSLSEKLNELKEAEIRTFDILQSSYSYFYTTLVLNKSVDIAVQPLYGDTDLYGTLCQAANVTDLPFPSSDSYQYSSTSPIILEAIHLTPKDLSTHGSGLKISVLCLSTTCGFSIYYDQGMHPLLADNRPMQGKAAKKQFSYFRYLRNQNKSITVVLSVIGSSNPDLFVSKDKEPSIDRYDWSSSTYGGDTLIIPEGELGLYFIGVYCEYQCSFSIMVITTAEEFLPLYPGFPQYMSTQEKSRAIFYFWNHDTSNIEIKVTVSSGQVLLLANPQNPETEEMFEKIPDIDKHVWISLGEKNTDTSIVISSNHIKFCKNCNIIISVISSFESRYTITVVNKSYLEVISNGVAVHGFVNSNEMDSFMFTLDHPSDIEIILTVYSGDTDIYVDTTVPVSDKFYKWKSNTKSSLERISITRDSEEWKLGIYYMAVMGMEASSYSLLVYCEKFPIAIDLGLSRRYQLDNPLNFILSQNPDFEYTCTVTSLTQNSHPRIFINLNSDNKNFPTPSKHDIAYEGSIYDSVYSMFSFKLQSKSASTSALSVYSLSLLHGSEISLVCITPYTIMKIGQHDYTYYELKTRQVEFELLASTNHDIRVTVFSCQGSLKITISNDRTYSSSTNIFSRSYPNKEEFYISKTLSKHFIRIIGLVGDSFEIFTETMTGDNFSMQPGGNILVKKQDKGFKVSWSKVLVNNELYTQDIEYYVYHGKFLNYKILNYCSLNKQNKDKSIEVINAGQENQAMVVSEPGTYVTVVAVFVRHRYEAQGFAVYDLVKLTASEESTSSDSSTTLYLIVAVLLILMAAIIFKFQKSRSNSRRSEGYELSSY